MTKPNRWVLPTATSSYAVRLADGGPGLVLDHWGIGEGQPWVPPERQWFQTLPDVLPLEYTAAGTRHVSGAELLVYHGAGLLGARLHCDAQVSVHDDGRGSLLTARMRDTDRHLELRTMIATSRDHDVVRKWVEIRNVSADRSLTLNRVFSGAWQVPVGPGARVDYLAGAWSAEFMPVHLDLPAGELSIGSRQGITSHRYAPVVTVSALTGSDAAGSGGGGGSDAAGSDGDAPGAVAYGIALAWSGSWRLLVDAVPFADRVRVACGIDDETTVITLGPGESFTTPETLGIFSPEGRAGLSRRWHDYQRRVLARSTAAEHRPIIYNSWYATKFDVRAAHQIQLAEVAAGLGAEVFVVDDGWFRGRHHDAAGLGDWTPDPGKFPAGLSPLITQVCERGMRFGIWIEPEAVNPDSDLFRAHPDWVYRAGDRPLVTVRNQYVLDLGRPEVVGWIEGMLRELLSDRRISYLKWDMNRPISDGGRPGDDRARQWSVQHVHGYYRVLRMLRREFPHVTVEACAGGGGRIDNGVLALSDVVWPSDETGPRDRLAIQHGFLSAYPPSVMSSWVTDAPDTRDGDPASFEFRFLVAMAGVLGIGADLLSWDETRRARATELVALYRDIRHVIHNGTVMRHGTPADPVYALEYGVEAGEQARTVLLVFARPDRPPVVKVRPRTLAADGRYRIRASGMELRGDAAAHDGIEVPFALAADADVIVVERR